MEQATHSHNSTLRERIIEHVFVGEALRALWRMKVVDVEVLRSEFDAGGYDLVMSYGKIVRHIQFKSMIAGGKAASVSINLKLLEKPSGCVIWVVVRGEDLVFDHFRWFGDTPGKPLPDIRGLKIAKHAKGDASGHKAEKPNHRIVPHRRFTRLDSVEAVLRELFGSFT